MLALENKIRETERSRYRVVIEETPTRVVPLLFAVISGGILLAALLGSRNWAVASIAILPLLMAIYASVRSKFIADRSLREFLIERRILFWSWRKAYQTAGIDRVYLVSTQKGSGLAMRFKSGRKKNLTMSLGWDYLNMKAASVALNEFIYTPLPRS